MQQELRANILIIISGICYGLMGFFGTKILQLNMSVACMLFWRFFIAAIWLMPLNFKNCSRKNFPIKTVTTNVLSYCGSCFFYFLATFHAGTGIPMVIFFAYPVIVLLFAFYFDSKPFSLTTMITLTVITMGLILLKGQGQSSIDLMGIVFALLAALSYAIYVFFNRKKEGINLDSRVQSFLLCLGCAMVFLFISLYQNQFTFPVTLEAWSYILGLSIIATAIAIQLMLVGLKQTSAVRASILSVFEPLVTFVIGIFLLHETVSTMQIVGVIVVLASVILYQLKDTIQPSKVLSSRV